jgi:acetolactate synthase-1/2/3 large subunit
MNGNELICASMERLGIAHVFGVPGTQSLGFFEALRKSRLRTVAPTSESSAAFMAIGYYRASGRLAVLTTIPGPGFAFTLAALAEAQHDSTALLYITDAPPSTDRAFALQALDQARMAGPVTKAIFEIQEVSEIPETITKAYLTALGEEPGPVMVHIRPSARREKVSQQRATEMLAHCRGDLVRQKPLSEQVSALSARLRSCKRPLVYAGQGTLDCAQQLRQFAEILEAPVVMTRSARGVLPMDHRLAFAFNFNSNGADAFDELLDQADLILVLGCKLGHNGTAGFRIRLPEEKLVRVDSSGSVLRSNYPARLSIQCDVPSLVAAILERTQEWNSRHSGWDIDELSSMRVEGCTEIGEARCEPELRGSDSRPGTFFSRLREYLPRESCVITDSGRHQVLTTRYFLSLAPRELVIPSDFQSMGFGISAAIGARFACPQKSVVVIVGDGGMAMCGMELLTAVREGLNLTVIVFNDEALGQIEQQQHSEYGFAHATSLRNPDFKVFAESMGLRYEKWSTGTEDSLRRVIGSPGITLVEVNMGAGGALKLQQLKGIGKSWTSSIFGESSMQWLKQKVKKS